MLVTSSSSQNNYVIFNLDNLDNLTIIQMTNKNQN